MTRFTVKYVFMIFVPIVAIILFNYIEMKESLKKEGEYLTKICVEEIKNNMSNKIDIVENIGDTIANNTKILRFLDDPQLSDAEYVKFYKEDIYPILMESVIYSRASVKNAYVFMKNENIPEGWGKFMGFWRIEEQPWIKAFLDSNKIDFWCVLKEEKVFESDKIDKDYPTITYSKKIRNKLGDCTGILLITFNQQEFYESIIKQSIPFFTMNIEGKQVEITEIDDENLGSKNYMVEEVHNSVLNVGIKLKLLYKGEKHLFVNLKFILLSLLLGMGALLLLFYKFIQDIFRTINNQLVYVKRALSGEVVKVPFEEQDEIGELANSFNALIDINRKLVMDSIEKETLQKNTQIKALQYQINPHFFYNTLEIISSKMVINGELEIAEVISDFGKMLRYNINSKSLYSTLIVEMEYIIQYINIQKIRYNDRVVCRFFIDEKVKFLSIIKFIIQPIVENSIIHGMKKDKVLTINIRSFIEKECLNIIVSDDGKGMEKEVLEKLNRSFLCSVDEENEEKNECSSIGLQNINNRITLFYGYKYPLDMESMLGNGTITRIRIPMSKVGEESDLYFNS